MAGVKRRQKCVWECIGNRGETAGELKNAEKFMHLATSGAVRTIMKDTLSGEGATLTEMTAIG